MCGIAGAFDLTGTREFPGHRLLAMTGGDRPPRARTTSRSTIEPGVALGARRLSIVDLAGGRQPIANEDGSVWVAFNGELFEYPELRQELLARGHRLATRCDTEAWVHLYEDRGEGMFEKARGQFAVSLWDRNDADPDPGPRPGRDLPALLRRGATAGCSGARRSRRCSPRGWSQARPDPQGIDHLFTLLLRGDDADVLRGGQVAPAGALPQGQGRPGRAEAVLGPRLPRRRRGAPARRPDAAGRRAGGPAAAGGRAAAAGRRAGRQLHQRRARLDGRARA